MAAECPAPAFQVPSGRRRRGWRVVDAVGFGDEEEQRGAGLDQDLGVVAGGFEFGGAGEQGGFEVFGALDGGAECGGAEGMEVAAGCVHDDEALVGEQTRHQAGKGGGEGGELALP